MPIKKSSRTYNVKHVLRVGRPKKGKKVRVGDYANYVALVKWSGYTASHNSWEPCSLLKHLDERLFIHPEVKSFFKAYRKK